MKPKNVWPNSPVVQTDLNLEWLIRNQGEICRAWPARAMIVTRPLKLFPDGRVRIEFVGTFRNSKEAREACMVRVRRNSEQAP